MLWENRGGTSPASGGELGKDFLRRCYPNKELTGIIERKREVTQNSSKKREKQQSFFKEVEDMSVRKGDTR